MEERQVRIKSTSRGKPAYVNHLRSFAKRKPHSDKHIANRIFLRDIKNCRQV